MMISAFLIGFGIGFALSVPIGPINLSVINEAFRRGFFRALMLGLGGLTADMIYCTAAFAGFSSFFEMSERIWRGLQHLSGLLIFGIGLQYLLVNPEELQPLQKKAESTVSHFKKAFPVGFVLGISNPALFIMWGIVSTLLISNKWIQDDFWAHTLCVVGIASGSASWFAFISFQVVRTHHRLQSSTLKLIERISGAALVGFGIMFFIRPWLNTARHWSF